MSKKGSLGLNFAMFLLFQLITHISNKELLKILGLCILHPNLSKKVTQLIGTPPSDPYDYTFEWDGKKIFQNESDYIKKQFFYIFYKEEIPEKIQEVENLPLSKRLLEEAESISSILGKNLSAFDSDRVI